VNLGVGIFLLVMGMATHMSGIALVVAQIINPKDGATPIAQQMAGLNWEGIAKVLHGFEAIIKALGGWPLPALLIFLALVCYAVGIWILVEEPIPPSQGGFPA
jgi:hypothetical protein